MEIGIDTFVSSNGIGTAESDEISIKHLLERIAFADKLGLHVYGIGEHYTKDKLDSSPSVLLAAAAAMTTSIRLTSAVSGIGTCDPVKLYQDFATIDLISNGRAEIVAGRGASVEAWSLFGLNIEESPEIFREKLDLLLQIRDNEFVNWKGKYRSPIENMGIYPRAKQVKMPVWHAVLRTPASAIRAGELGMPLMLAVIDGQIDQSRSLVELYREAGLDAGYDEDELMIGFHSMGYVAETTEQAIDEFYPGWADAMSKQHSTPKSRTRFDLDLKANGSSLLVGNPQDVAEKLLHISKTFGGISRFCFQMDYAGLPHEKLMKSIELIGKEVMPIVNR